MVPDSPKRKMSEMISEMIGGTSCGHVRNSWCYRSRNHLTRGTIISPRETGRSLLSDVTNSQPWGGTTE
jgi:hypothetical protein